VLECRSTSSSPTSADRDDAAPRSTSRNADSRFPRYHCVCQALSESLTPSMGRRSRAPLPSSFPQPEPCANTLPFSRPSASSAPQSRLFSKEQPLALAGLEAPRPKQGRLPGTRTSSTSRVLPNNQGHFLSPVRRRPSFPELKNFERNLLPRDNRGHRHVEVASRPPLRRRPSASSTTHSEVRRDVPGSRRM